MDYVDSYLIRETASTTSEEQRKQLDITASASTAPEPNVSPRAVRLFAGLVLVTMLTTASVAGTAPVEAYFRRRDELFAESSTADVKPDREVLRQVDEIFRQGATEFFQDGMYSTFSRSLLALLREYGPAAFRAIAEYVFSGNANPDVVSEALRWLADFNDPATLSQRWAILEHTLRDESPRIRDGAILGFAALDDPRARSLLFESLKSEPIPELRRLIGQVIDQLNATDAAATPQR